MKKTLLFLAVSAIAATAMADDLVDITPSRYKFTKATALPNIIANPGSGVWNLSAGFYTSEIAAKNEGGLLIINGNGRTNLETGMRDGISLVNLGGTCGQVFAFCRADNDVNADLEAAGVKGVNLVSYAGQSYDHLCWMGDAQMPESDNGKAGVNMKDVHKRVRVTIEFNVHSSKALMTANASSAVMKAYMNTTQIGVTPEGDNVIADTKKVTLGEFSRRWDEVAKEGLIEDNQIDEPETDDNSLMSWNPERWMVYEYDTYLPKTDGNGVSYGPLFIKMELPGTGNGSTLFIRDIKFSIVPDGAATADDNARKRRWRYYTLGATSGVENVAANNNFSVSVNGNDVTFGANADVYSIGGARVANVEAGKTISLSKGLYVATSNGKAVKVVVK